MSFSNPFMKYLGCALVLLCMFATAAPSQNKNETATKRATKATKALNDMFALPADQAVPKELIYKAQAIAVFPDTSKVNMLFQKFMKGFGLVSRRVGDGWSTPAYYGFAVMDRGWSKTKTWSPNIIILFMDDTILMERDGIQLSGAAGPVGELTREKQKQIAGANIIIYAIGDGKAQGIEVEDDSTVQSGINSDNNVNKSVYGLKAREVLAGTPAIKNPIPSEITEFQNTLPHRSRE